VSVLQLIKIYFDKEFSIGLFRCLLFLIIFLKAFFNFSFTPVELIDYWRINEIISFGTD